MSKGTFDTQLVGDDLLVTNLKFLEKAIKEIFLKTFASELGGRSFDFNRKQDKFQNWDSFSHMELVANIEKEFDINLEMEEIISVRSPRDFVNLVKRKKKL